MKTISIIILLVTATHSFSQSIFPGLSPKGSIVQRVGFTDITVDYERPAARGRKVFGELVEYEKLWRTGAGYCTKIRFSKPVIIDHIKINKGTYSVFTIPHPKEWTVILNSDTTLYGVSSYDEKKDITRFKAKPKPTDRFYESMTIDIDVEPNNAIVYIAWEQTQISFRVETETDKVANDFIQQNLLTYKSKDPDDYAAAAEYDFFMGKDLARALILIDKAIILKNESWYYRQKIDILEKQMKYKEAIDCAYLAISLDNKRDGWDDKSKQQNEEEYTKRIEYFKSKLKN